MIWVREVVWIGEGKRHAEDGAARSVKPRYDGQWVTRAERARRYTVICALMGTEHWALLYNKWATSISCSRLLLPSVSSSSTYQLLYLATSAVQLPPEIEVAHVVIQELISPCSLLYCMYFPSPPFKLLELPIACKLFLIPMKPNISIDSSLYQKVFTVLTNADIVQSIYF